MTSDADGQRLFVAIDVPPAVAAALEEVQHELRTALPDARIGWTRPEAMHLTLRFLGDVPVERVRELGGSLEDAVAGFHPIDLVCAGLGVFPDARRPRVVWAGVGDERGRLRELAALVNLATEDFAQRLADARFEGHVTIGRPKDLRRDDAERLARSCSAAAHRRFGAWTADTVHVVRSDLASSGSRYSTITRVDLRSPRPA